MKPTYLAADFGGGSGRIIAGCLEKEHSCYKLILKEIHRFGNRPVNMGGYLYWDFPALFADMKEGLKKAAIECKDIVSIGIDTWGVDFGIIDRNGNLVGNPLCYRDNHTAGLPEKLARAINTSEHYAKTGTQMLSINTLFQLWGLKIKDDPRLEIANKLLFMPDLFGFFLTGKIGNEYTIASTSELLNATTRQWDSDIIKFIGVDSSLFGNIVYPGEIRGTLLETIAAETGLPSETKVINVASHDTASAVYAAAESYETTGTAFLSSGTWSLLGVVLDQPVLTEDARIKNFTNEGGVDCKICFLTNITGLWILQQLKHEWETSTGISISWNELTEAGRSAKDVAIIDVTDERFASPNGMQKKIEDYCMEKGLPVPGNQGEFVKCVCASLAHSYKKALDDLNNLLPQPVRRLKIFGGGSNNSLLNELTEEITGLEISKGPVEATAIGNILVQAIASGYIQNKKEITEISGL